MNEKKKKKLIEEQNEALKKFHKEAAEIRIENAMEKKDIKTPNTSAQLSAAE